MNRGSFGQVDLEVALLFDLCLLTAEVAQVVQLGATYVTAADDLDVVDDRRVNRELTLDSNLERDLTNGEGFADSVARAADNDALEDLDTAAATFDDVDVNLDVVADTEIGDVATERRCVNGIKLLHDVFAFCTRFGTTAGGSVAMSHLAAPPKQRTG